MLYLVIFRGGLVKAYSDPAEARQCAAADGSGVVIPVNIVADAPAPAPAQ